MSEIPKLWIVCVVVGCLLGGQRGALWSLALGPLGLLVTALRWCRRGEEARAWERHARVSKYEQDALLLGLLTTEDSDTGRVR